MPYLRVESIDVFAKLNDANRVDILAVRLIEECIVRSNLEAAVILIEIIKWQADSAEMLFEMLDEQSCYEPLERIYNIGSFGKDPSSLLSGSVLLIGA